MPAHADGEKNHNMDVYGRVGYTGVTNKDAMPGSLEPPDTADDPLGTSKENALSTVYSPHTPVNNDQPQDVTGYRSSNPRIRAMDYAESPDVAAFAKYVILRVAVSAGLGDGRQLHVGDDLLRDIKTSFAREDPSIDPKKIIVIHLGERCGIPLVFDTPPIEQWKPRTQSARRPLAPTKALRVFARNDYQCVFCGSRDDLTIDHIVPVSKGGTDFDDNLQTLCRSCNSRKGARL